MSLNRTCAPLRNNDVNETGDADYAGRGILVGVTVTNSSSAVAYVRIYDKATGATSSDTPKYGELAIAATSTQIFGAPQGLFPIDNGLSARATTDSGDSANTGVGANEVTVHYHYQELHG